MQLKRIVPTVIFIPCIIWYQSHCQYSIACSKGKKSTKIKLGRGNGLPGNKSLDLKVEEWNTPYLVSLNP